MEIQKEKELPLYDSSSAGVQRQRFMVNPKYPLPSSLPVSAVAQQFPSISEPYGNGVARTTSRRRKASGRGQDHVEDRTPTIKSEAAQALPVSYDYSYPNESPTSPTNNNLATFAARARAAPNDLTPGSLPGSGLNTFSQISRPVRRGSINRPPGAVYLEIRGTERKSLPSPRVDSTSPQFSSNITTPKSNRETGSSFPRRAASASTSSKAVENPANSQSRLASRRVSTGTGAKAEWASDRSPLQKLEGKLNDISKEEKRARVEEAEQLLKKSKVAGKSREINPQVDSLPSRRQSDRVSSATGTGLSNEPLKGAKISPGQAAAPENQKVSSTTRRISERGEGQSTAHAGSQKYTPGIVSSLQPDISCGAVRSVAQPSTYTSLPPGIGISATVPVSGQQSARALSSQTSNSPTAVSQHTNGRGGSFAGDLGGGHQRASSVDRIDEGRGYQELRIAGQNEARQARASLITKRAGPLHHPVGSSNRKPEVTNSPGISPVDRPVVDHIQDPSTKPVNGGGLSGSSGGVRGALARQRQQLSDLLHRHPDGNLVPMESQGSHSRGLDEWRQGETARLTIADAESKNNITSSQSAWWEKQNGKPDPTSRAARRPSRFSDGDYDEAYGKHSSLQSDPDKTFRTGSTHFSLESEPFHVRGYMGNDKHPATASNQKSWLRNHISQATKKDLHFSLGDVYSYSCPQLGEHDVFHPYHICKPYVSRELTRSMRSIRLRVAPSPTSFNPPLYLKCGPLLRYTGLRRDRLQDFRSDGNSWRETWRGSVMIVTTDEGSSYNPVPVLQLFHEPMDLLPPLPHRMDDESNQSLPPEYVDPIAGLPKLSRTGKTVYVKPIEDLEHEVDLSRIEDDGGLFEETRTAVVPTSYGQPSNRARRNVHSTSVDSKGRHLEGQVRSGVQQVKGVRLCTERGVTFWRFNIEVELGDQQARVAYRINNSASVGFWVPARGQSMNIMFHTCNGFSMSVDPANFSGPDPLWRDVLNQHQRRPFHVMIGGGDQIYNDAAMTQTTLFRDWLKIKNPHHKHEAPFTSQMQEELETFYLERYSMWFSQGLFGMANSQIPMVNMWDDHDIIDGFGSYPDHFMRTPVFCGVGAVAHRYYMLFQHQSVAGETSSHEPSWLLGAAPGPYIGELSRSVFMCLGKQIAFLGLDCRTERRRDEILSEESYDLIFDRCRRELIKGETKHLIVLLGVPIAYPRLVWLENILTSRAMDPIKALGRTGLLGGFLNKFDGSVEVLDDLDDHWTSKNHKHERNWFIQELQELAAQKSVRVTILGGDVHLAAIGQFYSNPKLRIPKDQDHRYMANVISSAIVNTPPPEMMGDILNKRNKIHHLDNETDESMIPMFTHDVDGKSRNNKRLLPRRNWCSLREYHPGTTPPPSIPHTPSEDTLTPPSRLQRTLSLSRNDVKPKNLFRRLSQRGSAPPRDYPPSNEYRSSPPAAIGSSPSNSPRADGYFTAHRTPDTPSSIGNDTNQTSMRHSSAPPPRPGNFHRRPTNLSEKAAKKGNEGQEEGHINLEYGLDVVLNCEVNQKDPAGLTTPYRLLIPALWYQGEGDSNSEEHKKTSWIRRLGSVGRGRRRRSELAKRQGQGNWGGYSDDSQNPSDSEAESEPEAITGRYGLPPRRMERGPADAVPPSAGGGESLLPQQRRAPGNAALYGERRSSKVDDLLGMAGPVENGNGNAGAGGSRNSHAHAIGKRWSLGSSDARLQAGMVEGGNTSGSGSGDFGPQRESNGKFGGRSGSKKGGKGYDGIEAYRESRWRRFF